VIVKFFRAGVCDFARSSSKSEAEDHFGTRFRGQPEDHIGMEGVKAKFFFYK